MFRDKPVPNWPDPAEKHAALNEAFFGPQELLHYMDVMRNTMAMNEQDAADWMQKVREGFDEPLKGMLIALAPKVDRVNFIACVLQYIFALVRSVHLLTSERSFNGWQGQAICSQPLSFLGQAICSVASSGVSCRPGSIH